MLLLSLMGPVRKRPAGTSTVPPPLATAFSRARRIASVFFVLPSAIAPKSRMSNTAAGNLGRTNCGTGKGAATGSIGSEGNTTAGVAAGVGAGGALATELVLGPACGISRVAPAQAKRNESATPAAIER